MIPIFQTDELLATKMRALYQRRKGRDLFDLAVYGTASHETKGLALVFSLSMAASLLLLFLLVLGFGAVAVGVPLDVGFLAALLDRAVAVIFAFSAGGFSAARLWRRSPADFKAIRSPNATRAG